jgi:hypothetical protein
MKERYATSSSTSSPTVPGDLWQWSVISTVVIGILGIAGGSIQDLHGTLNLLIGILDLLLGIVTRGSAGSLGVALLAGRGTSGAAETSSPGVASCQGQREDHQQDCYRQKCHAVSTDSRTGRAHHNENSLQKTG